MVVCCMYFFETIPEARVEKGGYKLAHIHVQIRHLFKSKYTLEWNILSDSGFGRSDKQRERRKDCPCQNLLFIAKWKVPQFKR